MNIVEAARAFGLAVDKAIYRSIDRKEAEQIATRILQTNLAYGTAIMSHMSAKELWRELIAQFTEQPIEFATNAGVQPASWTPATQATFDMGVLMISSSAAGCPWVEDED